MDQHIKNLITHHWPRKLIALLIAIVIWLFVNQSITAVKVIPRVPLRVVNLPPDKTIVGLRSNGYLSERITLTLYGPKDVLANLEAGDLEALIDASASEANEWIISISPKELVSLNPQINPYRQIKSVHHNELIIKLSKLVTDTVPIIVKRPIGKAPEGYELLEVWPTHLKQTISGPEEEIRKLKAKGLKLIFDLNAISKEDLDKRSPKENRMHSDEVSFAIPEKWKRVAVPFEGYATQKINDPVAKALRIDFLRTTLHPLGHPLPIQLFYPIDGPNPENASLVIGGDIIEKQGLVLLNRPLFVRGVSRLFLEIVQDHLLLIVTATPSGEGKKLPCSVQVLHTKELEDLFVAFSLADLVRDREEVLPKMEELLRRRFRLYLQRMEFYLNPDHKLNLRCLAEKDHVRVEIAS